MSDQNSENSRIQGSRETRDRHPAAGIPWLAVGLAAGAVLGSGSGSLAWGLGVGAAIGLGLQQVYGRKVPARR